MTCLRRSPKTSEWSASEPSLDCKHGFPAHAARRSSKNPEWSQTRNDLRQEPLFPDLNCFPFKSKTSQSQMVGKTKSTEVRSSLPGTSFLSLGDNAMHVPCSRARASCRGHRRCWWYQLCLYRCCAAEEHLVAALSYLSLLGFRIVTPLMGDLPLCIFLRMHKTILSRHKSIANIPRTVGNLLLSHESISADSARAVNLHGMHRRVLPCKTRAFLMSISTTVRHIHTPRYRGQPEYDFLCRRGVGAESAHWRACGGY